MRLQYTNHWHPAFLKSRLTWIRTLQGIDNCRFRIFLNNWLLAIERLGRREGRAITKVAMNLFPGVDKLILFFWTNLLILYFGFWFLLHYCKIIMIYNFSKINISETEQWHKYLLQNSCKTNGIDLYLFYINLQNKEVIKFKDFNLLKIIAIFYFS